MRGFNPTLQTLQQLIIRFLAFRDSQPKLFTVFFDFDKLITWLHRRRYLCIESPEIQALHGILKALIDRPYLEHLTYILKFGSYFHQSTMNFNLLTTPIDQILLTRSIETSSLSLCRTDVTTSKNWYAIFDTPNERVHLEKKRESCCDQLFALIWTISIMAD